ncbi:DgyrCDS5854 [Dimorphilus gyrociliatus]|uniref:DgyrCDS5854 n=1 Tax=Dimorphilus gyrociliatus TaxID=2664684 RepID=A0A7I8VR09_9ANNE|nr:DgyrCDS5854 [Dimorphilus gyrociliatus]
MSDEMPSGFHMDDTLNSSFGLRHSIKELIISKAVLTCVQCKIDLCESCSNSHKAQKVTASHNLLTASQRGNYCPFHRQHLMNYYCSTCKQCVCIACITLNHNEHDVEELVTVASTITAELQKLLTQSDGNAVELSDKKHELSQIERELKYMKECAVSHVKTESVRRRRAIQEQEHDLIHQIENLFDITSVSLEKRKLEKACSDLETERRLAKELLSSDTSPATQVIAHSDMEKSLKSALSIEIPDLTNFKQKLDEEVKFIPCPIPSRDSLGSVFKMKINMDSKATILTPREAVPSSKILYSHSLKLPLSQNTTSTESESGERSTLSTGKLNVMGLVFLPGNDLVLLCSGRKYKLLFFDRRGILNFEAGSDDTLEQPTDIVVTSFRSLAITDCGSSSIKVIDIKGQLKSNWRYKDFELPIAICRHPTRNLLFVCDQGKRKLTGHKESNGDIIMKGDVSENHVPVPQYITTTTNTLYIADSENDVIAIYTLDVTKISFLCRISTSESTGIFQSVSGISSDRNGLFYITDSINSSIKALRPHKSEIQTIVVSGKCLRQPKCFCLQSDGDNLMAVVQLGPDTPETAEKDLTSVDIFKMVRSDI